MADIMRQTKRRLLCAAVVASAATAATVATAQEPEYVAVKAGRVITVSGEEFAPGVIVIEDGKITAVGSGLEFPATAEVIDAPRLTVMPGLIHPRSRYGLPEFKRSGVHGNQTASTEVYLDTIPFDELLHEGFTTVCFVPTGNAIPGMASVYRTAGEEESRLIDGSSYLHVNATKKSVLRDALKKAKDEIEKVEKARKEWEEKQKKKEEAAKQGPKPEPKPEEEKDENGDENGDDEEGDKSARGADGDDGDENGNGEEEGGEKKPANGEAKAEKEDGEFKPPPIDPKYQPLVDVIEKKEGARMMVTLGEASHLLHLDDVLEAYEDLSYTLYLKTSRSTDYNYVVDALGERKARVVLRPWLHYLPQTTFRYNLIDKLTDAGCEVSVVPRWDRRIELARLRGQLAELVRSGLKKEDAYKALTLHPARLLGLEEKLGSIEKGRDGDLVFFDGDPLDPHTTVQRVMILGKTVYNADEDE